MGLLMDKPTTKELARFLIYVRITKSCWLWIGCFGTMGYGYFWYRGQAVRAHRFSYRIFVGAIEPGKQILHRKECGNRNCVNPHHLYMGTSADNVRDKMIWGNAEIGERHGSSKLSENDIMEIRRLRRDSGFTHRYIGKLFNISSCTIGNIIRRETWKHLP